MSLLRALRVALEMIEGTLASHHEIRICYFLNAVTADEVSGRRQKSTRGTVMKRCATVAMQILMILAGCGGGGDSSAPNGLPADAETAAEVITASALLETVTQIASDEMMGRGPGTEGDRLARAYLAKRLEAAGYGPAFGESGYEQPMSMIGVTTELPEGLEFRDGKGREISLHRADEFIGGSGVQHSAAVVDDAELVFVGYGITAPEEDWDDYKGADLGGKMLVMLNDDPDWDPELF